MTLCIIRIIILFIFSNLIENAKCIRSVAVYWRHRYFFCLCCWRNTFLHKSEFLHLGWSQYVCTGKDMLISHSYFLCVHSNGAVTITDKQISLLCLLSRPSWSSSTPACGTLLPWGRTTRKPSPVSTASFSSILSSFSRSFRAASQRLPPLTSCSRHFF